MQGRLTCYSGYDQEDSFDQRMACYASIHIKTAYKGIFSQPGTKLKPSQAETSLAEMKQKKVQ